MSTSNQSKKMMASIQEAARVLRRGGVCVIPTETSYGLAASIDRPEGLERIYRIKRRPFHKPLLVLVDFLGDSLVKTECLSKCARLIMEKFWPGPVTLLVPAADGLHRALTGGTGKVGVRKSSHPVATALVRATGMPLTATSANISGGRLPKSIGEVKEQLRHDLPDFFLDAGIIPSGPASSIVDATVQPPAIVRKGAVNGADILAVCEKVPS